MNKGTFASLFSGCGGFDAAFYAQGLKCDIAVDIDPDSIAVYRRNLHDSCYEFDLTGGAFPEHKMAPEILLSGSPCQGFSTVGKRNINDPRNHLLLATAIIAKKLKPAVILAENVAAVTAGAHRKYWEGLHEMLRLQGYWTTDFLCDGVEMGVAQVRRRRILIAWRNRKTFRVELPKRPGGDLRSALKEIGNCVNHHRHYLSGRSACIAQRIKPGEKLCNVRGGTRSVRTWDIPAVFGRVTRPERQFLERFSVLRRRHRRRDWGDADPLDRRLLKREMGAQIALLKPLIEKGFVRRVNGFYDLTNTFNGKYRRLKWDEPALTVDTRFGDPRLFLHPDENRGFTVREAARIQGFPDSFVFDGSERAQYRMIGNAVPPPMASVLATYVREAILS